MTRKNGFDRQKVTDNARITKICIDNYVFKVENSMLKMQLAIIQATPIPKYPSGAKSGMVAESGPELIMPLKECEHEWGNSHDDTNPVCIHCGYVLHY